MPVLRHPSLPDDQTFECFDAQVEVWESVGWVVVDEPTPAAAKPRTKAATKPRTKPAAQDASIPEPAPSGLEPDAATGDVDTAPALAGKTEEK